MGASKEKGGMGFRDFTYFNKAFLPSNVDIYVAHAKQLKLQNHEGKILCK